LPVKVTGDNYVIGIDSLAAVSASASRDSNGLTHVSLVNINPNKGETITVNFNGANYTEVSGRVLASAHLQDHNTFEDSEKIKPASFTGASLKNNSLQVKLPPASVVVLELK
jgi:alpha-N-arabinofuranosidase